MTTSDTERGTVVVDERSPARTESVPTGPSGEGTTHRARHAADDLREPEATPPRPAPRHQILLGALFVGALAIRWFEIRRSNNIFVDEVTYAQIARNVATGHGLTLYGSPFNLHPPTEFGIFAGAVKLFGLGNLPVDKLILDLRPVVAVFSAVTVVLVAVLASRSSHRFGAGVAVVTGLAAAIDPFAVYFDSRLMLEAIAQFFVAATVVCLVAVTRGTERSRRQHALFVAAGGVAAAGAFTSKETFGLVLAATLVLLLVLPGLVARRDVIAVLVIGVVGYVGVTSLVWTSTGFTPWWNAHRSGLSRLIGTEQSTGFNASSTKVSLVSRVAANVDLFAGSYLVLGLGGVAVLVQLYRARPWRGRYAGPDQQARTIVAVWGLAAGGYLAYATLLGSIEEQMYYIPLAPLLITLVVSLTGLRDRTVLRRGSAVLVAVVLIFNATVWFRVHTTDNNTYEQLVAWERVNVNADARIAVADDTGQFLLGNVAIGKWTTIKSIEANNADFVLVESSLVEQGYSAMSVRTLDYLKAHATVAFEAHSDLDGTLYLFDTRRLTS